MGFNRSGEVKGRRRRRIQNDFARMLWESRWISLYAIFLCDGLQWLLSVLLQFAPREPLRIGLFAVTPLFFGYLASIWLLAAERALRGGKVLADGCFRPSRRNWLLSSGAFYLMRLPQFLLSPADVRLRPLWALAVGLSTFSLGFVVLGQGTVLDCLRSAREAVRRPLMVVSTLVLSLSIAWGLNWAVLWGGDWFMRKVEASLLYDDYFSWGLHQPPTILAVQVLYFTLIALAWLAPGVGSAWIYWKCRPPLTEPAHQPA